MDSLLPQPLPSTSTHPLTRASAPYIPLPQLNDPFVLDDLATRNYKTQYANIYFTRLLQLRPVVSRVAGERWKGFKGESQPCHRFSDGIENFGADENGIDTGNPKLLKRILNVERKQLCYIIGTIYMEMPLKPNILEDMGRDVRSRTILPSSHPTFSLHVIELKCIRLYDM